MKSGASCVYVNEAGDFEEQTEMQETRVRVDPTTGSMGKDIGRPFISQLNHIPTVTWSSTPYVDATNYVSLSVAQSKEVEELTHQDFCLDS